MTAEKFCEIVTRYGLNAMMQAVLRGKTLIPVKSGSKWFIADGDEPGAMYGMDFGTKRQAQQHIDAVNSIIADIRAKESL